MPTGNATSSSLCTSERSGDALEGSLQTVWQLRACLGIVLLRALVLASTSCVHWAHWYFCHSPAGLATLIRQLSGDILLALDTPGWRRQLRPRYPAHQERCDICSVLLMGALLAPPSSFTHRYTHFKLSSVFQESRKYLLKIFMQKLFMAWPTSTLWQPLHNTAQRRPYLEEHTASFAVLKSPRSNSSGFSIKSGTWGLDVQFRCQVLSSRLCQAAFSCFPVWRGLW